MNVHKCIRANNQYWLSLYYDELIDNAGYQLSYCSQADEPFYNCAQAVSDITDFSAIESYFQNKNLSPAFYTDSLNEEWLVPLLKSKHYQELPSQQENIWYMELNNININSLRRMDTCSVEEKEFRPVIVMDDLKLFLRIDTLTNDLPPSLAQLLFSKLIQAIGQKGVKEVESKHFIIYLTEEPVGCGSLGIYKRIACLAEGGTLPAFRRRGLHHYSMQQRILYAYTQGAEFALTTCRTDSVTNMTAKKTGMKLLCTRHFFQKQ